MIIINNISYGREWVTVGYGFGIYFPLVYTQSRGTVFFSYNYRGFFFLWDDLSILQATDSKQENA